MKFPPGYVPGSGVHKASGFGGFGERLLRQQGWEKGEGLGKHKTGRAEAIQVKKKEHKAGVSDVPQQSAQVISLQSAKPMSFAGRSKQESGRLDQVVGRSI